MRRARWSTAYSPCVSTFVHPTARPFVGARYVEGGTEPVAEPQTFTPTADENKLAIGAVDPEQGSVEREFTIGEGADEAEIKLEWAATPEDYDLVVSRVGADGQRQQVGDSGNAPGSFESVTLSDPAPGT